MKSMEDIRQAIISSILEGRSSVESILKILFSSFNKALLMKNLPVVRVLIKESLEAPPEELRRELQEGSFELTGGKPRREWLEKIRGLLRMATPIVRFAPNPSGSLHLGHSRIIILNAIIAQELNGKYILRIEDTDPERIQESAIREIPQVLYTLGVTPDEVQYQSKRGELYMRYLLRLGSSVFHCTCSQDSLRYQRENKETCEHTELSGKAAVESFWNSREGTLRVLLDPQRGLFDLSVARVKQDKVCFLMNYTVTVDDYDSGVNLVIRGEDHVNNEAPQRALRALFAESEGVPEPVITYVYLGKIKFEGQVISTSKILSGELPREMFLEEYLQRHPLEPLWELWREVGLSRSAIELPKRLF